ncbi:hypothetical protein SAMN05444004_1085 [Jannaschia faecimaris]|uniref:Uncharacterized protein n=1 Tax=Jannaschia faecimaris TaxID=1244108 RepID=A0A1H3R9W2_9RHOB|nr:hypothetical protein SAMN05444004_1085 [Jannaschia faecimaris]
MPVLDLRDGRLWSLTHAKQVSGVGFAGFLMSHAGLTKSRRRDFEVRIITRSHAPHGVCRDSLAGLV